jgi:DNA-binding NarL/FixJ family response regulator
LEIRVMDVLQALAPLADKGCNVHQRSSPLPIRVAIADDHGLFRAGVHALLSDEADIEVVGEFEDGRALVDEVQRARVDILLLDLDMPYVDGYQVLQQLRSAKAAPRAIVLTAIRDPEMLSRTIDMGARGVVAKKGSTRHMVEAIRAVHAGMRWLDPTLRIQRPLPQPEKPRAACAERRETRSGQSSRWADLTARECEVAELVAGGQRYKEVARQLNISEHTVKNHLRHIFDKLEIKSRVQLALSGVQRRA